MYVLINCNFDGDSYVLFNKLDRALEDFNSSKESGFNNRVVLVEPNALEEEFGFGSRGDVFGAKVIEEWSDGDQEDDGPICGICGGDATICDGC